MRKISSFSMILFLTLQPMIAFSQDDPNVPQVCYRIIDTYKECLQHLRIIEQNRSLDTTQLTNSMSNLQKFRDALSGDLKHVSSATLVKICQTRIKADMLQAMTSIQPHLPQTSQDGQGCASEIATLNSL